MPAPPRAPQLVIARQGHRRGGSTRAHTRRSLASLTSVATVTWRSASALTRTVGCDPAVANRVEGTCRRTNRMISRANQPAASSLSGCAKPVTRHRDLLGRWHGPQGEPSPGAASAAHRVRRACRQSSIRPGSCGVERPPHQAPDAMAQHQVARAAARRALPHAEGHWNEAVADYVARLLTSDRLKPGKYASSFRSMSHLTASVPPTLLCFRNHLHLAAAFASPREADV